MSGQPIPQDVALRAQLAAIAGAEPGSSYFEIRSKRAMAGGMDQQFVPVAEADRAKRAIVNLGQVTDTYVGVCPRVRESGKAEAVERAWILWADCDDPAAVEKLRGFRPLPSIVIRSGSEGHVHAYWQLGEPVSAALAVRANRRLALALGADRASTDAARILRPCRTLNHKLEPPVPVVCVRLEPESFTLANVVRGLPDDPAYVPPPARSLPRAVNGEVALAGLARVVREAPMHERNTRLNWAAYRAGEHAAAGTIDPTAAEDELLTVALAIGLSEREAQRTIDSGLTAATGRQAA